VPRYWLRDTPLLVAPGGSEARRIQGPVLVELAPDGQVRAAPGATEAVEGYLPQWVLQNPEKGRGLMLYAQRFGDLHAGSLSGPRIGRIYPGAFVSVAPGSGEDTRVDSPFGGGDRGALALYVGPGVLGVKPQPLAPRQRGGKERAIRASASFFDFDAAPGGGLHVEALACHDIVYSSSAAHPSKYTASQYVEGVELRGEREFDAAAIESRPPVDFLTAMTCPPRSVARGDGQFVPRDPDMHSVTIDEVPPRFLAVDPGASARLATAIEQRHSIHWLVVLGKLGLVCNEWRFDAVDTGSREGKSRRETRLVRATALKSRRFGWTRPWYPVLYSPPREAPEEAGPGSLGLGPFNPFPRGARSPSGTLRVVGDELFMGMRLPDDVVAFDPSDAERWFFSSSRCETARQQAAETLQRDGADATRLGIHHDEWLWTFNGEYP